MGRGCKQYWIPLRSSLLFASCYNDLLSRIRRRTWREATSELEEKEGRGMICRFVNRASYCPCARLGYLCS